MGDKLFERRCMGPVKLDQRGPKGFFSALVFVFPLDAEAPQEILSRQIGYSILAIFGTIKPRDLAAYFKAQRVAHLAKP